MNSRDINSYLYPGAHIPVNIGSIEEARVEELLGSGGFGVVCLITDVATRTPYALKVIRNINSDDEDVRTMRLVDRIRLEAEVSIPSPHVVRALGICEWDASTYLLLFEYFPGRSLGELIRENALGDSQKRDVLRQVLQGVADAHLSNVIHRDLKPENILVGGDGVVKVIDFGLAKFGTRGITTDGSFFGTLRYMAPELLLSGSHLADTRSDIYSLGHVFYEMLTGQHYWQHIGWRGLEDFACYLKLLPPPTTAIDLGDFEWDFFPAVKKSIAQMVRIQPEERPASAEQILVELDLGEETLPPFISDLPLRSPLLIIESGSNRNARTVLGLPEGGRRSIGRRDIAGDDTSISRRHAEFSRQGDRYFISDLNSKNGTFLRGQGLEPGRPMEIRHGDRIKMGEVFLRFAFLHLDEAIKEAA